MKRKGFVTPQEREALVAHVTNLHEVHGMTYKSIGEAANFLSDTTVQYIYLGYVGRNDGRQYLKRVRASTYEALMAVRPSPPPPGAFGAHIDIVTTSRRLRALVADGYPLAVLARYLGIHHDGAWDLSHGHKRAKTTSHMRDRVVRLYDKLNGVRPEDMKLTPFQITYARNRARKLGWAPTHCWDWDTIDDPNAWPEWTGHCDSRKGYLIHRRDGIPMCQRCGRFR